MGQAREYIRSYINHGRLQNLIWFALVSYGIAFIEWSLSPAIAPLWVPSVRLSDNVYFNVLLALAFVWIFVVGVGLKKCGWPGLLMLASVKWGLYPFYLVGSIYWACAFRDVCL